MSTLRKNTAANYIGIAWGVVSVYLFVPLYLKFLGIEAYGLIGFYSTLLGVLVFADMGLTATLSREMARLSVQEGSARKMADLLRTYESIYLVISVLVAGTIWCLAPFIAERWLKAGLLQTNKIALVIRLMGIAIALQLPSGLYSGGLLGLQKQVLSNLLQMAWGVLRGVGAVLLLWLYSPTILAFAFWQVFSNAVYCFTARSTLWRALPTADARPQFNRLVFRDTWRYAAGMAGMALISTILVQADKLVVSKMLPLEIFGYYTLASSLALAPMILANPIGVAVFPRLTGLVSVSDSETIKRLYHKACRIVSVIVLPGGLTLALFAGTFIFAWTGSAKAAEEAGLVAAMLLGGQIIRAITVLPYHLVLARGQTKFLIYVEIFSVILLMPLLIWLVGKYGSVGGGIACLVMNLCILPPYMYFLHRRFLSGELRTWILRDVGRPLLAALPIIILGRWLLPSASSRIMTFCLIGFVWCLSTAAAAFAVPELRSEFMNKTSKLFAVS